MAADAGVNLLAPVRSTAPPVQVTSRCQGWLSCSHRQPYVRSAVATVHLAQKRSHPCTAALLQF